MRPNHLRQKLNAGEPTIGTHILSSWPTLVELIGDAENYDYVEFTAEYAPFTMHDLDNLGRAFELKNLSGMIKIEQKQYTHQAMRAIGSGFQSVLYPLFQFTDAGVLDGIEALGEALEPAGHWSRIGWLLGADDALGGERPLDALRCGEVDKVLQAARDQIAKHKR